MILDAAFAGRDLPPEPPRRPRRPRASARPRDADREVALPALRAARAD
jgi:hypothetical protein